MGGFQIHGSWKIGVTGKEEADARQSLQAPFQPRSAVVVSSGKKPLCHSTRDFL